MIGRFSGSWGAVIVSGRHGGAIAAQTLLRFGRNRCAIVPTSMGGPMQA
jgi:hypothetical protein